jgi:hypothetical protein
MIIFDNNTLAKELIIEKIYDNAEDFLNFFLANERKNLIRFYILVSEKDIKVPNQTR